MNVDLARRAVKCKWFRWLPGMQVWGLHRVSSTGREVAPMMHGDRYMLPTDALPDLDDPATKGCLLALVRKAYGDQGLHINRSDPRTTWGLYSYDYDWVKGYVHNCETEADALVSFLEALDTAPR